MLRIGGLTRLSSVDYPGKLAAVVYCQGCAWRCGYCHNPDLLAARSREPLDWPAVLAFLASRKRLLDAVVFSGGEPTLQRALGEAMQAVKALGFLVGLHTAGISPRNLSRVLPLVDWVAMDVKAPWHRHHHVTRVPGSGERARESMARIIASRAAWELHTVEKGTRKVVAARALRREGLPD